jgi:hypothetical protein
MLPLFKNNIFRVRVTVGSLRFGTQLYIKNKIDAMIFVEPHEQARGAQS